MIGTPTQTYHPIMICASCRCHKIEIAWIRWDRFVGQRGEWRLPSGKHLCIECCEDLIDMGALIA